jgi:lipopolysaccharide transport system ATP-binding protein
MTSNPHELAIHVDAVSKRFQLGAYSEYSRLTEVATQAATSWLLRTLGRAPSSVSPARRGDARFESDGFWALRDVNFSVKQSEVVGVIGHNGAGKSTLLKILSRIVTPTRGRVGVRGRVGSLLEVGTGFHPELTGRENIFLNGAILGLKRSEIRKRFDEIVAFAEVESFLDTPVKRYSSGMTVRLGFSVAAHLEPDVLIIDEVLSVGDQAFQRKCMGKATELGTQGRTVLVVSHNLAAIANMCSRVVLLDQGLLVADDLPSKVIERYLAAMNTLDGVVHWAEDQAPRSANVRLRSISVNGTASDTPTPQVDIDAEIGVTVEYEVTTPGTINTVQILLKDESGIHVLTTANAPSMNTAFDPSFGSPLEPGVYRTQCWFPPNFLNDTRYFVTVHLGPELGKPTISLDSVLSFLVHDTGAMRKEYLGSWSGPVVRPRLAWTTHGPLPSHSDLGDQSSTGLS